MKTLAALFWVILATITKTGLCAKYPAVDDAEIRAVLARERWARDTLQWDRQRECFHPDANQTFIDISWFSGNVDGFISGSKNVTSDSTSIFHVLNPADIHFAGGQNQYALVESLGQINTRFTHNESLYDLTSAGRFVSRVENVENVGWRLLTLQVIYLRDNIIPVGDSPPIEYGEPFSRVSYRYLAWHLIVRGLKTRKDLPGIDDPASVANVMDAGFAWLNSKKGE